MTGWGQWSGGGMADWGQWSSGKLVVHVANWEKWLRALI